MMAQLGSFVIFQGIRTSIAKKPYIFVIFLGGGPPDPRMRSVFILFASMKISSLECTQIYGAEVKCSLKKIVVHKHNKSYCEKTRLCICLKNNKILFVEYLLVHFPQIE